MAITEFSLIPSGARVRVRRGRFPMGPSLVGRVGTVLENSPYDAQRVSVTLDGETEIRAFAPGELELVDGPSALPRDQQEARKRLARP
ncbi:MAG TPA: hypothetical protein VMM12_18940 [Longimicrobiales bacterium]|nr:hypothetical protein [Longimicrobiales bacterium]